MYRLEVKQKERKKRFRPTDDVTFIYDDEYDYPTRKIINEDEYKTYCALWGEFIQLLTVVRWRNKPVDNEITRIKIQKEPLQKTKDVLDELKSKEEKAKKAAEEAQKDADKKKAKEAKEAAEEAKKALVEAQKAMKEEAVLKKLKELNEYEAYHVKLWKAMDDIIEKLSKNDYVKRRNLTVDEYNKTTNDAAYTVCRMYQEALYDMIYP